MSLKDLTAEKHKLAESTPFMKAIFDHCLPMDLWVDFTYQKYLWYREIELAAASHGLLDRLPGISRAQLIMNDYQTMVKDSLEYHTYKESVKDYVSYIRKLEDPKQILAHLYTWHMGDMFGGQMIKTMIPAPHTHLTFDNAKELMTTLRTMITDDLADEANTAFDWAIKILSEYDV
jgi:heme oxygenase